MPDNPNPESFFLDRCLRRIEERLGWADSNGWRNQDFAELSEKICEATGILLSVTTLKRLWGKLPYDRTPNAKTLNALAAFLEYENWQAFRVEAGIPQIEAEKTPAVQAKVEIPPFLPRKPENSPVRFTAPTLRLPAPHWRRLWPLLLLLPPLALAGFLFNRNQTGNYSPDELARVRFTSRPVAAGVPNTVVFNYDVAHLGARDVQIQQTWDTALRFAVAPDRREVTSTYYYPGYWRAKLLVDGRVLREHDLYIRSDGWLATLGRGDRPHYFSEADWTGDGRPAIRDSVLTALYARRPPDWLTFHYIEDFGELDGDRFSFSARLRNTYRGGDGVCRQSRLILQCTEGVFVIPLSAPGCVGDEQMILGDRLIDGRDHDLSAFGCDFSDWQELSGEVRDRHVRLFRNGRLVWETDYEKPVGRVAGVRARFWGAGEVKQVELKNDEGVVVWADGITKPDRE